MTKHKNTQKVKDGRKLHLNFIHLLLLLSLSFPCAIVSNACWMDAHSLLLLLLLSRFLFFLSLSLSLFLSLFRFRHPYPVSLTSILSLSLLVIVCACLLCLLSSLCVLNSFFYSSDSPKQTKCAGWLTFTHTQEAKRRETIERGSNERKNTKLGKLLAWSRIFGGGRLWLFYAIRSKLLIANDMC